jgi:hypothetical protein
MSSYEPGLSETSNEFPRYYEALHAVIDHVAWECVEPFPRGENEWATTLSDCRTQILKIVKAQP